MRKDHLLDHMDTWSKKEVADAKKVLAVTQPLTTTNATVWWILTAFFIMANIIVMSVVVPLLVVMPNWALYGFLCLLGGCFGLLFTILFNDIAHFFSKQEHYLVILLVGVLSFIAGYLVYELARVSLTQVVAYNRYPFVLSLCYTASALLPMLLLQVLEKIKSFRFCRVNLYK